MYEYHGNKGSRRQQEIKEPLTLYRAGGFLFISCRRYQTDHLQIYSGGVRILNVQLGLGIFTVVGIQAAVRAVGGENVFFFVFIGTLTGVGGGVLRDIMAGETPYILVKHIYACAAIAGGIVCVVGRTAFGEAYGTILGLAATVLLRFLAAHFRWNLMRVS